MDFSANSYKKQGFTKSEILYYKRSRYSGRSRATLMLTMFIINPYRATGSVED